MNKKSQYTVEKKLRSNRKDLRYELVLNTRQDYDTNPNLTRVHTANGLTITSLSMGPLTQPPGSHSGTPS